LDPDNAQRDQSPDGEQKEEGDEKAPDDKPPEALHFDLKTRLIMERIPS